MYVLLLEDHALVADGLIWALPPHARMADDMANFQAAQSFLQWNNFDSSLPSMKLPDEDDMQLLNRLHGIAKSTGSKVINVLAHRLRRKRVREGCQAVLRIGFRLGKSGS